MSDFDPQSPGFLVWLAALSAEKELVVRMAMRGLFGTCRVDLDWAMRFDGLIREPNPSAAKLEPLFADWDKLAKRLEEEMAET
jgi:hypothetical protein